MYVCYVNKIRKIYETEKVTKEKYKDKKEEMK